MVQTIPASAPNPTPGSCGGQPMMALIRVLAVLSAAGLAFALWSVRRALAERAEAARWVALDDRTDPWP